VDLCGLSCASEQVLAVVLVLVLVQVQVVVLVLAVLCPGWLQGGGGAPFSYRLTNISRPTSPVRFPPPSHQESNPTPSLSLLTSSFLGLSYARTRSNSPTDLTPTGS
jgi:hypothetical protein